MVIHIRGDYVYRGKDPKTMMQKEKDELFIAMLKKLNMLDENDKIK